MKVDFSGDEIKISDFDELEAYRVARKMERDGLHYYSRMKEEVIKPEISSVLMARLTRSCWSVSL